MKRVLWQGSLAALCAGLIGCTEKVAPTVEQNANPVSLEPAPIVVDPVVVNSPEPVGTQFNSPPKVPNSILEVAEIPPDPVRIEVTVPPKLPVIVEPTLTTEPQGMTQISELREVRLKFDVFGVDPSELSVEFTAPEGQVIDRQVKRLSATRYDVQQMEFILPVAGTMISANQLVGTWQAKVFLAGAAFSSVSFEVTP